MLAQGYKLYLPMLAIETFDDGCQKLCVLQAGMDLAVVSNAPPGGKVKISYGNRKLEVFQADLEERSSPLQMLTD